MTSLDEQIIYKMIFQQKEKYVSCFPRTLAMMISIFQIESKTATIFWGKSQYHISILKLNSLLATYSIHVHEIPLLYM